MSSAIFGDALDTEANERKRYIYLLMGELEAKKPEKQTKFAAELMLVTENANLKEEAVNKVKKMEFGKSSKHPIMTLIWNLEKTCGLFTSSDFYKKLRQALRNADLAGVEVTKQELDSFRKKIQNPPQNGLVVDFNEKSDRLDIYEKITKRLSAEAILIGHFLLSTDDFISMNLTERESNITLVKEIFEKWDESTERNQRTWNILRSVILGLGYTNLVEIIEGAAKERPSQDDAASRDFPIKCTVISSTKDEDEKLKVFTYTKRSDIYVGLIDGHIEIQIPKDIQFPMKGNFTPKEKTLKGYIKNATDCLSKVYQVEGEIIKMGFYFPPEYMFDDSATKMAAVFKKKLSSAEELVFFSHYNIERHFELLNVNFEQACEKLSIDKKSIAEANDRFLLINLKQNEIVNVRCTQVDNKDEALKDLAAGDVDVRLLLYLFGTQLLDSKISIINIVAAPDIKEDAASEELGYDNILDSDDIKQLSITFNGIMKKCDRVSDKIASKDDTDDNRKLLTKVISLLFSFLATTEVNSTILCEETTGMIESLWLTDEQINAVLNDKPWKIVRGCYGSGKTVVGRHLIQNLVQNANQAIYYIVLDNKSLLLKDMIDFDKNVLKDKKKPGVEVKCWNIDDANKFLSKEDQAIGQKFSLSTLIQTLVSYHKKTENEKRKFHLFVDEVDNEMINENEAENLANIFEKKGGFLKGANIVFMMRPMEKERVLQEGNRKELLNSFSSYKDSGMEVINLSRTMRNSHNVSKVINKALVGISKPNTIPQPKLDEEEDNISLRAKLSNQESKAELQCTTQFEGLQKPVLEANDSGKQQIFPVFEPNETDELAGEYFREFVDSPLKVVCNYEFNESRGVGHFIDGMQPKMIFLNDENSKSFKQMGILNPDIIKRLAAALKEFQSSKRSLILCNDAIEVALFESALNFLDEDYILYVNHENITKIRNDKILITDHNGCRGLEFEEVIVTLKPNEVFKRQFLIDSMSRSLDHLILVIPYPYSEIPTSNQASAQQLDNVENVSTIIKSLQSYDDLEIVSFVQEEGDSLNFRSSKKEAIISINNPRNIESNEIIPPPKEFWGNIQKRFENHKDDFRNHYQIQAQESESNIDEIRISSSSVPPSIEFESWDDDLERIFHCNRKVGIKYMVKVLSNHFTVNDPLKFQQELRTKKKLQEPRYLFADQKDILFANAAGTDIYHFDFTLLLRVLRLTQEPLLSVIEDLQKIRHWIINYGSKPLPKTLFQQRFQDQKILLKQIGATDFEVDYWLTETLHGPSKDEHRKAVEERLRERREALSENSLVYKDSTGVDLHDFMVKTLRENPRDRLMLLKLEKDFTDFINDTSRICFKYPQMTSYHRMLIHRVAAYFGLDHNVDSTGKRVIISRTPSSRCPDVKFQAYCSREYTDEELADVPKSILPRSASSDDSSGTPRTGDGLSNITSSFDGSEKSLKSYSSESLSEKEAAIADVAAATGRKGKKGYDRKHLSSLQFSQTHPQHYEYGWQSGDSGASTPSEHYAYSFPYPYAQGLTAESYPQTAMAVNPHGQPILGADGNPVYVQTGYPSTPSPVTYLPNISASNAYVAQQPTQHQGAQYNPSGIVHMMNTQQKPGVLQAAYPPSYSYLGQGQRFISSGPQMYNPSFVRPTGMQRRYRPPVNHILEICEFPDSVTSDADTVF